MYKYLILLFLLNSCVDKEFAKINYGSSTMEVSSPHQQMNYTGDSCAIYVKIYSIGSGGIRQFKYGNELKRIESECYINGIKYNLDEGNLVFLKVPSGKLIISANDTYKFTQPLQRRKIFLKKNGVYNIFIYLMYDDFGMKKEKPKR
jgi:hypothetical protein